MTWQQAKLGDVCEVLRGTTITQAQARPGSIPVVAGGTAPTYFHDTPNRPGGTITVSASGANAGYVNFWDKPIFASDCSTVGTSGHTVDIRFMYHQLRAMQQVINGLRTGAAQPHVYAKDIAQLIVAVPPITEQRRIAAILDKAEVLRAKRREALGQLDRLAQSIFVEMFGDPLTNPKGWPRLNLGDLIASGPQNGLYNRPLKIHQPKALASWNFQQRTLPIRPRCRFVHHLRHFASYFAHFGRTCALNHA